VKLFFFFTCVLSILLISSLIIPVEAQSSSHPNLIVSAENTYWDNTFSGFQVIEIVVDDLDISDITSIQTEPNVTVGGYTIRMAQATDGKWYGYVASKDFVQYADSTVMNAGNGFDFGEFCASTTNLSELGVDFSDTQGVAIARSYQGTIPSTNGQTNFNSCSGGSIVSGSQINNVVKNPPTLVQSESIPTGQIGLNPDSFPIIQLYNFWEFGYPIFEYHKNGNIQSVDTIFDTISNSPLQITTPPPHRVYPNIFSFDFTFDFTFLNIDPTTKDSWTFSTNPNDSGVYYNIFDENGVDKEIQTVNVLSLDYVSLGFDETLEFTITDNVNNEFDMQFHSNEFQILDVNGGTTFLSSSSNIITIKETENKNGIFTNVDSNGNSNFKSDSFNPWTQGETYYPSEECVFGYGYGQGLTVTFVDYLTPNMILDKCATFTIQGISTTEDTPVSFTLSSNYDPHAVYSIESIPSHGIIQGTIPNLQYIPDENYFDGDNLTVKATIDSYSKLFPIGITIQAVQEIPISNSGADQTVDANSVVQLDGSQSLDVDGDTITYSWIQTAGDPVTLTDNTISNPQFTAPSNNGQLTFMLTVSDGVATSNPDVVNIYVGELVPEPTAPPAPSSLNTNPTNETVVLTWQTPDDGGSPIIDYVVEYQSENDNIWNVYNDGTASDTMSIISGLENNVLYQFRVSAVNSVGTSTVSSLISATPISSTPIVETPIVETPIVETPIVETPIVETPIVETPITPEPTLGIASFVDTTKDPQSYANRYNNEPTYKEWFDENYSQYISIYEAVGLEELTVGQTPEPEYIPEPTAKVTSAPNCGAGTEYVNGICQVIQTTETSEGGGCLIATATYGSEMSTEVQQLRELRDNQLLQTESGTAFIRMFNDIYYSFSPIVADYERENPYFKEIVKIAITPLISSLSILNYVDMDSEESVLRFGISLIILNLGMYLGIPAVVIVGIRKKIIA
jgi:hypothetical protein